MTYEELARIIDDRRREIEAAVGEYFPYRCRPCIEGDKPVRSSVSDKWVHPAWQAGRVVCGYSDLLNQPESNQGAQLALACLGLDTCSREPQREQRLSEPQQESEER